MGSIPGGCICSQQVLYINIALVFQHGCWSKDVPFLHQLVVGFGNKPLQDNQGVLARADGLTLLIRAHLHEFTCIVNLQTLPNC